MYLQYILAIATLNILTITAGHYASWFGVSAAPIVQTIMIHTHGDEGAMKNLDFRLEYGEGDMIHNNTCSKDDTNCALDWTSPTKVTWPKSLSNPQVIRLNLDILGDLKLALDWVPQLEKRWWDDLKRFWSWILPWKRDYEAEVTTFHERDLYMSQSFDISRDLSDTMSNSSRASVKSGVGHTALDVQVAIEYTRRTTGIFDRLKAYWLRIMGEISSSLSTLQRC